MTENKPLETQSLDVLAKLRTKLGAEQNLAQADLHGALSSAGVSSDVAGLYEKLEPRSKGGLSSRLGLIGQAIVVTLVVSTGARLLHENPASIQEASRIVLDNLVGWAGTKIDNLELTSIILGASTAAVWTLLPPKIYEGIAKRESARASLATEYKNGEANLAGKLGANIQIDVGKSDPSALLLTRLFHLTGKEVVTFWDDANLQFTENSYWQKTRNDWTSTEILKRGDIQESIFSVTLVSNGDDVFLSSRLQDPSGHAQDMTDAEAIGTVNARNSVRKQMGLESLQCVLVTNPQREIEIDVARGGEQAYQIKTVGQVVAEKYPNVHLVDPDRLVVQQLAHIAASKSLPLELVTNNERRQEYEGYLKNTIEEHNLKVEQGDAEDKARIASQEDGINTLSVFYGSTDDDTIAQIQSYGDEFSKEGEIVVVINDPEKVNRLPEGTKYVCVGTVVAEAVYQEFSNLVKSGKVKV
ncbi:MAG: hypothetical protein UV62_C0017G0005 [Parcubacteria group bacterium GW2011_GWC1_43_11]|nr:MAG: hypothetical protein UV62_C0017G0005 [Parcubacteria group bacterium GW2011_GWC1_43_11]